MYKRIKQCLAICVLLLLVFASPLATYAAAEKTPAPTSVQVNGKQIRWYLAKNKNDMKFRIYYKDKWSGDSYQLAGTGKGYSPANVSSRSCYFFIRDATNEEDPQVIEGEWDGRTSYTIPLINGHKYKFAVKAYDKSYGLWSDITTIEYYFLSRPEVSLKQTEKGVSVSWKPVPGATKYYVVKHPMSNPTHTQTFTIIGNDQTEFIDEDVIKGKEYFYEVQAGRGKWESLCSMTDLILIK